MLRGDRWKRIDHVTRRARLGRGEVVEWHHHRTLRQPFDAAADPCEGARFKRAHAVLFALADRDRFTPPLDRRAGRDERGVGAPSALDAGVDVLLAVAAPHRVVRPPGKPHRVGLLQMRLGRLHAWHDVPAALTPARRVVVEFGDALPAAPEDDVDAVARLRYRREEARVQIDLSVFVAEVGHVAKPAAEAHAAAAFASVSRAAWLTPVHDLGDVLDDHGLVALDFCPAWDLVHR